LLHLVGFLALNPGHETWFTLAPDDHIVVLGQLSK
jgi:hypothetical protein